MPLFMQLFLVHKIGTHTEIDFDFCITKMVDQGEQNGRLPNEVELEADQPNQKGIQFSRYVNSTYASIRLFLAVITYSLYRFIVAEKDNIMQMESSINSFG
jgi:hypothetical protein